jgi:hypothetical protein
MLVIFLTVLLITIIAETIGPVIFTIGSNTKVSLMPMLYAVIIGISITPEMLGKVFKPLGKLITKTELTVASNVIMIALLPLGVRYGSLISGSLDEVIAAGPALVLQEFGNLASVFIAIPIAVLLGLRREAIGACSSIDREPSLGVIGEKYGMNSPEGLGVTGVYIVGSVIGTIFFSIISPLGLNFGFHPLALATGCGLGSGSMLAACTSALALAVPDMADTIIAFGATANMIAGMTGVYILIFLGLPLSNFVYKVSMKAFGKGHEL